MNTRDELGFGDEMVLVTMLMDMSPPTMGWALVITMASISPSWREVSTAKLLYCRAKLLLPGSASRRRRLILNASCSFFYAKWLHIAEYGHQWTFVGHTRHWPALGGRARPCLVAPQRLFSSSSFFQYLLIFIYSKKNRCKFLGHLELRIIVISVLALFRSKIPVADNFLLHAYLA